MANTLPEQVFRGYDIRGLVETELTDEVVKRLIGGYATWLHDRRINDCVVGYDSRLTGPHFRDLTVQVLTAAGITVYDIGMTLTQIGYFAQYFFRTRGLVMITASHNPKEYNGFKMGTGFSETMITEEIHALRDLVKSGRLATSEMKGQHIQKDIFADYQEDLFRRVGPITPLRVVVDSCAATTGPYLPAIIRRAGCEVIEQNTKPDGNFPVGTADPTEREVQERLAERVKLEGADLGFSYDTDGDRVGIVDDQGNLIWNDTIVALFAKDVLDFLPGAKIVYNALCSKQVDETIRAAGGRPIMWMTGHSFIKAKSHQERAVFGGELSGHFFFLDNFYGHDDGAIATLRLLAYLSRTKHTLREAVSELPYYISSPEIKLGCPDVIKFQVVSERVAHAIKKLYPQAQYVEIDGVRMDTADRMAIVRASQNGPYLTIKFEGKLQRDYDELKGQLHTILRGIDEIDFSSGVNTKAFE